jgi:hypothetical protein
MDYTNFDLRLAGEAGAYTAEVLAAPAGQTSGPQAIACALPARPDPETASQAHLEAAGRTLWRCAFGAEQVAGLWHASLAQAAAAGGGLRLRLAVEAAALADMPWELLFDDALGRPLALDPATPVVRTLRLPFAAGPWPQGRALRLLFSGAAPQGLPLLRVADEAAAVAAALSEPRRAGRLTLTAIPTGATLPGLGAALRKGVDIWHFAGHGDQAGLVFDDGAGHAAVVEAGALGLLLAGEGVRLAVLNACRAGLGGGQVASVAGALVRAGVPAVIALQGNLSDTAAAALAHELYAALAAGQPVDRAVTAGRKAILALGGDLAQGWWLPALFLRAADGVLWRQEGEMGAEKPRSAKSVQGDEIHAAGPVATHGGVINTGGGVAFAGDGNVVITGKVGGNVTVSGGSRTASTQAAGLLPLLADIRSRAAALTPAELPPDDRTDALDVLDKASEQARRDPPPVERIAKGLEDARAIMAAGHGRAPEIAALLARAAQVARTEL